MATPFAALEARVNAAVFANLANATADFGGGVLVDGIFGNDFAEAFGVVAGSQPAFRGPSSALSAVASGAALSLNAVAYTVAAIEHDGLGITVLRLEKAA